MSVVQHVFLRLANIEQFSAEAGIDATHVEMIFKLDIFSHNSSPFR